MRPEVSKVYEPTVESYKKSVGKTIENGAEPVPAPSFFLVTESGLSFHKSFVEHLGIEGKLELMFAGSMMNLTEMVAASVAAIIDGLEGASIPGARASGLIFIAKGHSETLDSHVIFLDCYDRDGDIESHVFFFEEKEDGKHITITDVQENVPDDALIQKGLWPWQRT